MRIVKRSAWGFAGLLALVIGGLVALLIIVGGAGESAIEAWVGEQLKEVVGTHLKPELDFDTLDYQAPLTVVMTKVRLTADDPDNPGQRVDVIDAKRIRIELAELPREGRPLKIASLDLDGATIRLVDQETGGLIGFSDFVVEKTPGDVPPLSEVLQITEIVIRNGAIEYDARQPGTEPMRFDRIDTTLAIDQADGGIYGLDLKLDHKNVLGIKLVGQCDLDAMVLAVESLETKIDLSREQDHDLPPQVQTFIKQHDLIGDLSLKASGELDLMDIAGSQSDFEIQLKNAHGSVGGYRLPIEQLAIEGKMSDGNVTIKKLASKLLGGELHGEGGFDLGGDLPALIELRGNGLRLGELVVADETDDSPQLAGKVDLQVNAQAPLMDVLGQMTGAGELRLSEGRIARLGLISEMIELMQSTGNLGRGGDAPQGRDRAELVFELRGDHAYLSKAEIIGSWFAMRGRGNVFFDERLSLNVNAGPLERVQSALGAIGSVLGSVTDGLLAYRVGGRFSDLSIRPMPLGGLLGAPGDDD